MVGNKAQKAVAAALTGVLAFGGVAPAFAGMWTDGKDSWYRVDGSHSATYLLGTYDTNDDGFIDWSVTVSGTMSGTELVKGENRLDTMFDAINYNAAKYEGTNVAVLASGWSQADSLVAAGVAGMLAKDAKADARANNSDATPIEAKEVPVILTEGGKLSIQAKRAIQWLADKRNDKSGDFKVYLVGGTAALSEDVEDAVEDIKADKVNKTTGESEKKAVKTERLAGDDRMATSLEAAKVIDNDGWLDDDLADTQHYVYVAGGWAPADALSVSSCAYDAGEPILLTGSDGKLSEDQVAYLQKINTKVNVNVIGGPAAPTKAQLVDQGFTRMKIDETSGVNRYETSAAVIEWAVDNGRTFNAIAVASGADAHMADALIGGAFVGANDGVLALVDGIDQVTALKEAYADRKDQQPATRKDVGKAEAPYAASFIMGGEAAIDAKFADKLNDNFPVAPNPEA